ncbi:lipoyl synthase [Nodularia spumigena CCY9414]|nr:lipoyl synthase [Nodularia spumigena CCY9414]
MATAATGIVPGRGFLALTIADLIALMSCL